MDQEPERKLVAVLAADMVGFSRQLGVDEVGTLARLDRVRRGLIDPAVAEHRGRIFKVMGDGILAEFPSAVLALRAALAIQLGLADANAGAADPEKLLLRIGVHQGEVVIAGEDLLGDGINVAARIEPLAPPGGICVSARVHEDSLGKLPLVFRDLGERALKNIIRPVRVLQVVLPGETVPEAAPEPFAEQTLVGRAQTADAAEQTFVRRAVPPRRHVLLVSGPTDARRRFPLDPAAPLLIGRQPPCGLVLDDREISRRHCRIDVVADRAEVSDLQSTNGTFIDGRRIAGRVALEPGTRITIGTHVLVYECEDAGTEPDTTGAADRTFLHAPVSPDAAEADTPTLARGRAVPTAPSAG